MPDEPTEQTQGSAARAGVRRGLLIITGAAALSALALGAWSAWSPAFRVEESARAFSALAIYYALACLLYSVSHWARRRPGDVVLVLFSCALTCGIIEIGGAFLFPERAMMHFRWQYSRQYHHIAPAGRKMFKDFLEGVPVFIESNEDGLRTTYSRADFLKHSERIVMMGDSFTYGFGVPQEYAFPEVAQEVLRERLGNAGLAVLNAGMVSYSPFLANLLYDGIVKEYRPDVVLYFLDATDFGDDLNYAAMAKHDGDKIYFDLDEQKHFYYGVVGELVYRFFEQPGFASVLYKALSYPRFFVVKHILARDASEKKTYYDFVAYVDGKAEHSRYFIYRYPPEKLAPFFDATIENVNQLARRVRESGAKFALVVLPRFHHWNPKESPRYWEYKEYGTNEPYQFAYFEYLDQVKSRLDYPVFSLLPAFQKTTEFPLCFERDAHWNIQGHAFVARVITDYLIEQGLVK